MRTYGTNGMTRDIFRYWQYKQHEQKNNVEQTHTRLKPAKICCRAMPASQKNLNAVPFISHPSVSFLPCPDPIRLVSTLSSRIFNQPFYPVSRTPLCAINEINHLMYHELL